jgi:four helix bundle protein
MEKIRDFRELRVYQSAFEAAMEIFELSKGFPAVERLALTDQIRRSSRAVCANLGEAWRKRRYPKHFVSKITDAAMEASETRVWLEFAFKCKYLTPESFENLDKRYDRILAQLVTMESRPQQWTIRDEDDSDYS